MKLTVLGQYGPFPKANSACSGYLLSSEDGKTNIAVDMGTGTLSRLLGMIDIKDLTCVILSHLHFDHMSDVLALQYVMQFAKREKLPVYAPNAPEAIAKLLECPFFDVREQQDMTVGGISVSFADAVHPVKGVSVRFEENGRTFVYTGDTNWHDALAPFCQNADLLLADAGLLSAVWTEKAPHLSASLCGQLAAQCGAKKLLLTHFNPNNDPEKLLAEAKTAFAETALAEAGETYRV